MAVGTPVVVWRQGAMPEIVDEGETGFVVDSIERGRRGGRPRSSGSTAALCGRTSSGASRPTRMARDYETIYAAQVAAGADRPRGQATIGALA